MIVNIVQLARRGVLTQTEAYLVDFYSFSEFFKAEVEITEEENKAMKDVRN